MSGTTARTKAAKQLTVCGGSKGIGRAVCETLAAEGCAVAVATATLPSIFRSMLELSSDGFRPAR